jgi:hypothetical protein
MAVLVIGTMALVGACGDDDGDATCSKVCGITPLDCSAGPSTLQDCIDGCQTALSGNCGDEMQDYLNCAVDSTVSCDASGVPRASGCSTEETAYWTCTSTN